MAGPPHRKFYTEVWLRNIKSGPLTLCEKDLIFFSFLFQPSAGVKPLNVQIRVMPQVGENTGKGGRA